MNIKLEDIDWDNRQIAVKGGNRNRTVFMTKGCADALKEYLAGKKENSPYLFSGSGGGPLSVSRLHKVFRKYSDRLDLGYNITPHTLRNTLAAYLHQRGMPLAHIAGLLGIGNEKNLCRVLPQ